MARGDASSSKTKSGTKKSSSARSSSTKRKTPNKNTKAYQKQRQLEIEEAKTPPENLLEIYAIVCLAINLILVLGTYGLCGKVGKAVSGFFFGLFGVTFYILPFVFFIAYCFLLVNGPKPKIIKKIIWGTVFFMAIGFICQLVVGTKGIGIKDLYFDGYSEHRGGGILFGGLIVLVAKVISRAGAVIVTILAFLISIIEVTNVRIIALFKKLFSFNFSDVQRFDEDYEDYDDEYEEYEDVEENSRSAKGRDILPNIRVLDKSGKSAAASKKKERTHTNKIVHNEEVHEILPETEKTITRTASSARRDGEPKMEIAMPGVMRPRNESTGEGNDLLSEINNASAFYNRNRDTGSIAPDYKPKDFYELEPDSLTYDDPLGSNTDYNEEVGTISEKYNGPKKKDSEAAGNEVKMKDTSLTELKADKKKQSVAEDEKVTAQDKLEATQEIQSEIEKTKEVKKKYVFPPMKLLKSGGRSAYNRTGDVIVRETAITLKSTLESFGVNVTITNCSVGPSITRYELQPEQGVRVNKVLSLENDIKLALAATDIRIEAPIPGKASIGIEIPNKEKQAVCFRDLIDNDVFARFKSNVAFAVGKDISGQIIITDIAKMPHLLIAGATGSGKSVCINTIIMSILYKSAPEDVKLIMIDPKMVELAVYNGIPHLLIPVVTDPKKAAGALNWAVEEMTKRYQLFANYNVRNIEGFNTKVKSEGPNEDPQFRHMPQIVVIVDELADLMMVAHKEVEDSIVRLSQLARAAGIHLIIATQRPSVDVITGLIKANVPSRIALSVSSQVDSRTIIDMVGAEKLLGNGDMLFYPTGYTKPVRVQGAYLSDDEILSVVEFIKKNYGESTYDENISQSIETSASGAPASGGQSGSESDDRYDEYFEDAARFVIEKDKASIGYLQRMLRIGFNRAARIMDQLEEFGVVGPEEGTKPRKVLMSISDFEEAIGNA
ncbi:DNA translocase FtsK [Lachnospiraceae bacterium]|nr:DNA translocase FtsK [Lachnospiraceae bacterium]